MRKDRLLGVQYLRAIAALMVAYYHLTLQVPAFTRYLALNGWVKSDYFSGSVPVFFVISGFVMYISGIESKPLTFAWRRIARIAPLYWTLTLVIVMVGLLVPGLFHHVTLSPGYVAKSLLFIPYRNPGAYGQIFPILGPGWSLNYEMFFYAVFTAALFCPLRWRLTAICLVMLGLFGTGALVPEVATTVWGSVYMSSFLVPFVAGMIIGWAYKKGKVRAHPVVAWSLVVAGFVILISSGADLWARSEFAPTCIVFGVVALDAANAVPYSGFLRHLGDASYSIYLVHLFAFDSLSKIWHLFAGTGPFSAIVYTLVSMTLAVAMAFLTYRFIEQPALHYLHRVQLPQLLKLRRARVSSEG